MKYSDLFKAIATDAQSYFSNSNIYFDDNYDDVLPSEFLNFRFSVSGNTDQKTFYTTSNEAEYKSNVVVAVEIRKEQSLNKLSLYDNIQEAQEWLHFIATAHNMLPIDVTTEMDTARSNDKAEGYSMSVVTGVFEVRQLITKR